MLPQYENIEGSAMHPCKRRGLIAGGLAVVALATIAVVAGTDNFVAATGAAAATGAVDSDGFTAAAACAYSPNSNLQSIKLGSREFQLYVPSSVSFPASVVFVWHGLSADVPTIEGKVGMKAQADKKGFIVVYPEATNKGGSGLLNPAAFNGAGCCKDDPGFADVQFAQDIVAHLNAGGCANPSKVFSSGFSNGGFMTNRLACELGSDFLAGACVHSGLIGDYGGNLNASPWKTCRPVPMMAFHGTTDSVVPLAGGKTSSPFGKAQWFSFANMMGIWEQSNGCGHGEVKTFTGIDGRSVSSTTNPACKTSQFVVTGLAHDWWAEATDRCVDHMVTLGL